MDSLTALLLGVIIISTVVVVRGNPVNTIYHICIRASKIFGCRQQLLYIKQLTTNNIFDNDGA